MKPETLALHAGYDGDPTTHAATAPIYQTTSYTFDDTKHGADLFNLAVPGNIYSPDHEPHQRGARGPGCGAGRRRGGACPGIGDGSHSHAIEAIAGVGDNIVS